MTSVRHNYSPAYGLRELFDVHHMVHDNKRSHLHLNDSMGLSPLAVVSFSNKSICEDQREVNLWPYAMQASSTLGTGACNNLTVKILWLKPPKEENVK